MDTRSSLALSLILASQASTGRQRSKERMEEEGRGGKEGGRQRGRLEEKQPDSPAVCELVHSLQLHGRRGREGRKERGGRKNN